MASWCVMPNESLGASHAVADHWAIWHGWMNQSDLPNKLLDLEISDGKNTFNLQFGIQSDAPASAQAIVVASQSRKFLRRISRVDSAQDSRSHAEEAVTALFGDPTFPSHTPH